MAHGQAAIARATYAMVEARYPGGSYPAFLSAATPLLAIDNSSSNFEVEQSHTSDAQFRCGGFHFF
jgi:hypothetical protein